jgi:hypothetical protein
MTAAALLSRDTALADVRRRPKELHQYRDTLPAALIVRTKISTRRRQQMADRVLHDLTTFDRSEGGRVIPATAGIAGLADVLVLIMQGHRRISLAEVAAICGIHQSTAQNRMSDLRDAKILRAPEIGRKGESITRYEIGPVGAQLLQEAFAWLDNTKAKWDRWWAERKGAKGSRRSSDQHAKKPHRVSPPSTETDHTVPASVGNAGRVALALGQTGAECEHGAQPGRCAFCRRAALGAVAQARWSAKSVAP